MTKIYKITNRLALPLILLIGLGLRILWLARKPLWYDEACSVASAQKPLSYFFGPPHTLDYKPVYLLLLKLWIKLFGMTEFPIRLFSVIFSVLSVYLVYKLAKMLYNRNVAILSAFLLSISTFHIFHAQQTKHYSLMVAFVITSYLFFIKFCFKPNTKYLLFNVILNFLLLSTHPYGILPIITQYVSICIYNRLVGKSFLFRWIGLQTTGIIFYALLFFMPSASSAYDKIWWVQKPNPSLLGESFLTLMFGGPRYGLDDYRLPVRFMVLPLFFSVLFFGVVLSSALSCLRKTDQDLSRDKIFSFIILLCWLFLPLIIAYAHSYLKPVFLTKHFIYLLPPFLILAAKGLNNIKSRALKAILLVITALSSSLSLFFMYNSDYNIHWRSAAEYIRGNIKAQETIIICSGKEIIPFIYYFDYNNKDNLKMFDLYGQRSKGKWENVIEYKNIIIVGVPEYRPKIDPDNPYKDFHDKFMENKFSWGSRNLWLVSSRWGRMGNFPLIETELSHTHLKFFEKKIKGIKISYWKK